MSLQLKQHRMFHDDSMRSFFRRLCFTPDGSFLLAPGKVKGHRRGTRSLLLRPSGTANQTTSSLVLALASASWVHGDWREHHEHHLHVFQEEHEEVSLPGTRRRRQGQSGRADWTLSFRPVAHLPCPTKATLAVRCCPVYFELRTKKEEGKDTHRGRGVVLHLFHLYALLTTSALTSTRWLRLFSAQPVPAAVPHGVRRGVRGLHPAVRHAAGASLRPGGQHPLPHTQRPHLVTHTLLHARTCTRISLNLPDANSKWNSKSSC